MNLLLDSHTLLWLMEGSPSLSATADALIASLRPALENEPMPPFARV